MKMKKEKNVGKEIKKKIEKGGDKENKNPEIYENEGILMRKSIPRHFNSNFIENCGPDKLKSTNGEPSTKKLNTTGIVTILQNLRKVQTLIDLLKKNVLGENVMV